MAVAENISGYGHSLPGYSFDEKGASIDFGADILNDNSVSHDAVLDDAVYTFANIGRK
jgi:hypothetical protein